MSFNRQARPSRLYRSMSIGSMIIGDPCAGDLDTRYHISPLVRSDCFCTRETGGDGSCLQLAYTVSRPDKDRGAQFTDPFTFRRSHQFFTVPLRRVDVRTANRRRDYRTGDKTDTQKGNEIGVFVHYRMSLRPNRTGSAGPGLRKNSPGRR